MANEGKVAIKERFVELRAEGLSYADIASKLNVSKTSLIAWGKALQKEIANARTLRLDALFEKYAVAKAKRIEILGKRLDAILAELDRRDLTTVKTEALLALALKYGENLRSEYEPLMFKGDDEAFDMSFLATTTVTWPA
jgi:transposase